jgi:hypothetical protein
MKSVKVLLTGLSTIALVSGALAFRAAGTGTLFCRATPTSACSTAKDYNASSTGTSLDCGTTLTQCQNNPTLTKVIKIQ